MSTELKTLCPFDHEALAEMARREQEEQPAQRPIATAILSPETQERVREAARELRMAAITMEALAWQTEPALLEALVRGADRFLEIGGGKFSDALTDAGHPIPRDA